METDYVNQIQLLEKEISGNETPSYIILIKQTFVVWYLLVEGNDSLDEHKLQSILNRNISIINKHYPNEPNLLFLRGLMLQISPWFFDENENGDGEKYLKLAYKHHRDNLLFKWALRGSIDLPKEELMIIKSSIEKEFDKYYIDYQPIREYFKGIVETS
ncbi:hypothetical protein [Parapedobacter tibetensis]|uniref:hypothetical protein n=1 Tax=Parapedobacter tibetensis TaxID=2972951 RepID=UPI00214DD19D|nr:hypothetical protein [Parapedobacter tibetensis]